MDIWSDQELQQLHQDNSPVVLHFWAAWCEPCKHMDVVLAELAKDFPRVKFGRVEAEEVDSLTERFGVASVPTFVFLKGPACIGKLEGANPPALNAQLKQHFGAQDARGTQPRGAAAGAPAVQPQDTVSRIKGILAAHPVVLFMKGSADTPRCGFSRKVVEVLQALHAPMHTVDILQDQELREKLKEYSNWPTYPQLYISGELIGGCDIVMEMQISGELKEMLARVASTGGFVTSDPAPTVSAIAPATVPAKGTAVATTQPSKADVKARIEALLQSSSVLLFMKGSPEHPQCGFSRKVVEALKSQGIAFQHCDILGDEAIRQGLKEYSNWPTYPQLYVKGELLGGCDIVLEMQANSELKSTVQDMLGPSANGTAVTGPATAVTTGFAAPVSAAAADLNTKLKQLVTQEPVMVFMKGTPEEPHCGFSSRVVQMLSGTGAQFGSFDILKDEEVRQGLKKFSNWPTYPQVYVNGELLGGCDIVTELHNNGELKSSIEEMLQQPPQ